MLHIDIETYCDLDLTKVGVYKYTEHESFEVLMIAYAHDGEYVELVDLTEEPIPRALLDELQDPRIVKVAHNATFERVCLSQYFGIESPPEQWRCTMTMARYVALPSNLDEVAKVLKLDQQKDKGSQLIRYFSKPCRPTKVNGGRTRNLPEHDLEKWIQFKSYCRQDVEVERAIHKKLAKTDMPQSEWDLYYLDQHINDRGIGVDVELVKGALAIDRQYSDSLMARLKELTGLDNPKSVAQLKGWLATQGFEVDSLNKAAVDELIASTDGVVREVLTLRQHSSRTSTKKYEAMERAVCADGRLRGSLSFYGASRSGRWAGRLVQVHNLPRNYLPDLDTAREVVKMGDPEALEMLYDNVPDTLSQLIRTAFVPKDGHKFVVSDFSAIEARVIAWLADEEWRLEVFRTTGKIYEASAAAMFKVPIESIGHDSPLRQKGKVAELACGYQGSVGALKAMGADKMGLEEYELVDIIAQWREASPHIVELWREVEKAAITAVDTKGSIVLEQYKKLTFTSNGKRLTITLPSGRELSYPGVRIEKDPKFKKYGVTYLGKDLGQWCRLRTYGGKLVENIVQAIARDCLATGIKVINRAGYRIVMHVHDEVVLEVPEYGAQLEGINTMLCTKQFWMQGLPLGAEGFVGKFYKKD